MNREPRTENRKAQLILALDVDSLDKAERFVDLLYPTVKIFKVGLQLFTASGPQAVKMITAKGAKVFLDLKLHDIPNTVMLSAGSAAALATFMMTVHTKGGAAMLKAAVSGARDKAAELKVARPYIVGVTRLTSDENTGDLQQEVLAAARLAKDSGLDGVVCSVFEAALIRRELGDQFIIVTPGIRPKGSAADDQKRAATASEAIASGSDYLVVGRPILEATDPLRVAIELFN